MTQIRMKTPVEVAERLRDLLQRSRKRYVRNRLKPKGQNCAHVIYDEALDTYRCTRCGTTDPDRCLNVTQFEPLRTKDELNEKFREDIKNPQILLREYRAEAALLWVLGQMPEPEESNMKEEENPHE